MAACVADDECCWVEGRVGLEGPQACCMHGDVYKCVFGMEG